MRAPTIARMQHCTIHNRIVTAFWQKHVSKGGYDMAFTATATKAIPAGCGGSSAAHRAGARAQQPSQDQISGDPRLLPLRFHGELLGRDARRQGRAGMPQAQPRQAFRGCQAAVSAISPAPARRPQHPAPARRLPPPRRAVAPVALGTCPRPAARKPTLQDRHRRQTGGPASGRSCARRRHRQSRRRRPQPAIPGPRYCGRCCRSGA